MNTAFSLLEQSMLASAVIRLPEDMRPEATEAEVRRSDWMGFSLRVAATDPQRLVAPLRDLADRPQDWASVHYTRAAILALADRLDCA